MSKPFRILLMASGNGSNAVNLIEHSRGFDVCGLISDQPQAPVIEKSRALGIETFVLPRLSTKADHEKQILKTITQLNPDLICLCGYMRLLSSDFLSKLSSPDYLGLAKMINIHPSLLPSFKGLDAYEQAFAAGVKTAGVTLHFVAPEMDGGPIILQRSFERLDTDSLEDFKTRGLKLEHQLYLECLDLFTKKHINLRKTGNSFYVSTSHKN